MAFTTKIDFSNNRQVKQFIETQTFLSGGTVFGVPFSYLPTGADLNTSGITLTVSGAVSTFSGNSTTTNYTWYDDRMSIGSYVLSALTPSNSGVTQNTGNIYSADTSTIIDGNLVNLTYTGVSYDITPISFIDLGGGSYSGTVDSSILNFLSAGTIDFTGRTIWVDVSGITRTSKLIVTDSYAGGSGSIASGSTSFVHGLNSVAGADYTVVLGNDITGTTPNYTYVESLNIKTIASGAYVNDIRIDNNGNLTTNTSDVRMKENINPLVGSLDKIKQLNGVSYQWKDKLAGGNDIKLGFIAQEVEQVEPLLVFTNRIDGYKGIHIDSIIPILVEAVKELSSGTTISNNKFLETQTIVAEDNNIDLNYNGSKETAIGGGIRVLNAIGDGSAAELLTDSNGNWYTNNEFKPNSLIIPNYTPKSSLDTTGKEGNITMDDNFLYIKTSKGWKRSSLESF